MTDREREQRRQTVIAAARARRHIVDGRVVVDFTDAGLPMADVLANMPNVLRVAAEIAPDEAQEEQ